MRRHDIDPTSLTFGVLFLGFAAAWALVAGDLTDLSALRLVIPLVLLAAGIAGVAGPLRGTRSREPAASTPDRAGVDPEAGPEPAP